MAHAEIKKLNKLETHDRLEYFQGQDFDIGRCCQDLIDKRPFDQNPFYIFAHARTDDKEPGVKRIIWQPRLTRPEAQSNSMLFKVRPPSDAVEVIWILPPREMFDQFLKGKMFSSDIILESIQRFLGDKESLNKRDAEDLNDEDIDKIYKEISKRNKKKEEFMRV